jgi:F-type H+-transporting ATPase subunit epsilon
VRLNLISPERTVLHLDEVQHVLLPAENGELGVLPGHMPLVCSLGIGRIRVDLEGGSIELAVSGGYVHLYGDVITILAETAELADEIDVARAEKARERAREQLQRRSERIDYAAASVALERALNRLKVAGEA